MTTFQAPTIRNLSGAKLRDVGREPARVGIDTIRVFGPLAEKPDFSKFDSYRVVGSHDPRGGLASVGHFAVDGIKVQANANSAIGPSASWEISVPTWVHGVNVNPMPAGEVKAVLRGTFERAKSKLAWACDFDDLRISRLDIDRDFRGVGEISALLDGLRWLPIPKGSQRAPWSTTSGTHSLSIHVKNRWKVQLYDKHAQLWTIRNDGDDIKRAAIDGVLPEAENMLRFECQIRRACAKDRRVSTLWDLSDDAIERASRHYFDKVGFGTAVGGLSQLQRVIHDSIRSGTSHELAKTLGLLHFQAESLPGPYSPNTNRRYQKNAQSLGISPADLLRVADATVRLDYDDGCLDVSALSGYETPVESAA